MTVTAIRFTGPLTDQQLEVLGFMLADALDHREPSGNCRDCASHPYAPCPDHAADADRCDDYLNLARELGIETP